jgi:chorismate mutase
MTREEAERLLMENRAKIDSCDRKLVDLLNERTRMVHDIGRAKEALGMQVFEAKREDSVFRNVRLHNHGPIPDESLERIYKQIIEEMRALQGMKSQQAE